MRQTVPGDKRKAMDNLEQKVEQFIKRYGMISEKDKVITGVSGGADSVCLLFVLCALRERFGFEVEACHVNHCLRGPDAEADEAYVRRICGQLGVHVTVFRENVELISKNRKQSLEEAGRFARRRAFETMLKERGGTKIAAAHHQDDNAETVLLNIARGTGVKGLCGIRPVYGKWIRPLLCVTRAEIETWLEEKNIGYCTDATNEEDEYTRNRIRHNILPVMERQINSKTARHLNELSRQAEEVWQYMETQTQNAWRTCVTVSDYAGVSESAAGERPARGSGDMGKADGHACGSRLLIRAGEYKELAAAVQKFLIRRCIEYAAGSGKDIDTVHIAAVAELFEKQPGRQRSLPRGVKAMRVYDGVTMWKCTEAGKKNSGGTAVVPQEGKEREIALKIPGEVHFPGTNQKICCTVYDAGNDFSAKAIPQKSYTKCFDYDIIKYSLSARYRHPGDYLVIDGNGSRQKLKSYFINEKVPAKERSRKLLIADGDHIVWIPGMRMSREYQIGSQTKRILKIKITEE